MTPNDMKSYAEFVDDTSEELRKVALAIVNGDMVLDFFKITRAGERTEIELKMSTPWPYKKVIFLRTPARRKGA